VPQRFVALLPCANSGRALSLNRWLRLNIHYSLFSLNAKCAERLSKAGDKLRPHCQIFPRLMAMSSGALGLLLSWLVPTVVRPPHASSCNRQSASSARMPSAETSDQTTERCPTARVGTPLTSNGNDQINPSPCTMLEQSVSIGVNE
jgi:hypothetical protein